MSRMITNIRNKWAHKEEDEERFTIIVLTCFCRSKPSLQPTLDVAGLPVVNLSTELDKYIYYS